MNINQFYIAGINYKKTDATIRGQYAINHNQYTSILTNASFLNVSELFILSTCNRTEIYGMANSAEALVNVLCDETVGSRDTFRDLSYIKQGMDAVEHLFCVAAGLDSQILGDYEIVGQIKQAVKFAKDKGFIGTLFERLISFVLRSSKAIKNQTALSGGTVSVSFAAIQFLKENVTDIQNKKIVLVGTGKIGKNTCKNLVDYLAVTNITLINRTEDKATKLGRELQLAVASYNNVKEVIKEADIIIVATNAEEPVIKKEDLFNSDKKVLVDLSIPYNIDPLVGELSNIRLVNVDDLSKINDETLQKRLAEVPRAKKIINEHIKEFIDWYNMRKNVFVLKAVKQKLTAMDQCSLYLSVNACNDTIKDSRSENIQKVIDNMAIKMRRQPKPGCNYIEAINDYITSGF